MDQWVVGFIVAIEDAGLEIHTIMKYVDDVNLITLRLPLGTCWIDGRFVQREDWKTEDVREGRSEEHMMIKAVRAAADSIIVYLEYTADIPERHEDNKVPMQDIAVWVQHPGPDSQEESDVLAWTFYEKPSASVRVLRASSAYSWRSKLVTMGMEVFRRM